MGSKNSSDDDGLIADINVTPFVDVVLVLLIIFMVTATYIVKESIEVNLPNAKTGVNVVTSNLGFVIDKNSQLYFNGKPIEFSEIGLEIQAYKNSPIAEGKKLQASISADEIVPHGKVVQLIDTVRDSGILEFAINIEKKQ